MGALRQSTLLIMFLPSLALAQANSTSLVEQCGANLKTAAYNTLYARSDVDMTTVDTAEFCREYSKQSSSQDSGSVNGGFKGWSLGGSSSSADAKAVYEMACNSTASYANLTDNFVTSVQSISVEAMEAYKACLNAPQDEVRFALDAFNPRRFGLRMTNRKFDPVTVKRVDMIDFGGVKCSGSLADVGDNKPILKPGDTLSMVCLRKEEANGSLPEMTVMMDLSGSTSFDYNWEGREPCGTRGERSCTNTRKLDRRAKYPEESGGSYDRSKAVKASSRPNALDALVQANIPLTCTPDQTETVRSELSETLKQRWGLIEVSSTVDHSCTKGSSGGTKDCKTKYTLPAPAGFQNARITTAGKGYDRKFAGTRGQIYMRKSGKGRMYGSVTAHWRLTDAEIDRRVSEDLAYIAAASSCFNGCAPGLAVNQSGVCK